jgi:hypothetical protein
MCVAIILPPNVILDKAVYKACFDGNRHGSGFGYYDDKGRGIVCKGYMEFDTFWENFEIHRNDNLDKTFLVHFRIRTLGTIGVSNSHPFQLKNMLMIHNGHISGLGGQDGQSDTAELADLLNPLEIDEFKEIGEELSDIFSYNAVWFLTKTGEVIKCGNNKGSLYEGAWFSHMGWKYEMERVARMNNPVVSTVTSADVRRTSIASQINVDDDEDYLDNLHHAYRRIN